MPEWQPRPDIGFESKPDWQGISTAPVGLKILTWKTGDADPAWLLWDGDMEAEGAPTHWYPVPKAPG